MTRGLTPGDLVYGFTPAADPRLAPDGTTILYTRRWTRRGDSGAAGPPASDERGQHRAGSLVGGTRAELWLCDADGGSPRRLELAGRRNHSGRWSPDGRAIAFVCERDEGAAISVVAVGGGEPRPLVRHRLQVPAEIAWSPDGRRLAYVVPVDPANLEEEPPAAGAAPPIRVVRRLDYKQDGRGLLLDVRLQVCVVDVGTGERRQLTSKPADHFSPLWSPDGRTLATRVGTGEGWATHLLLLEPDTGAERRLDPAGGRVDHASWSPSRERLLVVAGSLGRPHPDLFLAEAESGAVEQLTERVPWVVFSPPAWLDERRALLHVHHRGASVLLVLDVDTRAIEELHRFEALNDGLSVGGRLAVQAHESLDAPGELVVFDLDARSGRLVTRLSEPVLAAAPQARWETFAVEREGVTLEAWLLFPPDFDPRRRHPLVLDVHGGPHLHYGYCFDLVQQALAAAGFLVVYCNPRGSSSYGDAHAELVNGDWGGGDYHDLLAVVDAVCARPYADSERVGITGYSYGGYMTAWAIGQSDRFRAAVCGVPVFDLVSQYGTSDVSPGLCALEWGGAPHERPEWYAARSPSTFAHRATTPTLILAAEDDLRCPIGQSEALFVALSEAGCEVELVRYAGVGHAWFHAPEGHPEHRLDVLERTVGWFGRHLGGPEPTP
jgi:dipeptidyl aminopeptidase/acylaminoacyl peptidase